MKLSVITSTLLMSPHVPLIHVPAPHPDGLSLVAFPGTQTIRDLLVDDLDVRSKAWPPETGFCGRAHGGFARRTSSLMHHVLEVYRCTSHAGIILAGHSMGGACAVLAAAQLWEMERASQRESKVARVLTFGMPRMGNRQFDQGYHASLGSSTIHFSTPLDPVVHRLPALYSYPPTDRYVTVPCHRRSIWEHHDMRSYHEGLLLLP